MLPPSLLSTCKVVYVCRNVKDVAVSMYNHTKALGEVLGFKGSFEDTAR